MALHRLVSVDGFFDAIADEYESEYGSDDGTAASRLAWLQAELPAKGRILDLGTGTGRALRHLARPQIALVGVDISPRMLSIASLAEPSAHLVRADFWCRLPFEDAEFDGIFSLNASFSHPTSASAVEHLATEVWRLLKPGGIFFAEILSYSFLDSLDNDEDFRVASADNRVGQFSSIHRCRSLPIAIKRTLYPASFWRDCFKRFDTYTTAIGLHEWVLIARRRS